MRGVFVLSLLLAAGTARADPTDPLRHDVALDASVTGAGAVLWLSSELLFKHALAPPACRWCDRDAAGHDTLNGFDRGARDALVWGSPSTADALSNLGAFGLVPLLTLGGAALAAHRAGANGNIGPDLLVIGEATVLAQVLNQSVKFAVGRERPFVHRLAPDQKPLTAHPDDNDLSFFSGHTTFVFALATAAGTVCSMHGYPLAPWVWAGGLTFAVATALLRIGADKHYATDVLAGALVGSAFGVGVPRLFHPVQARPGSSQGQLGLSLDPLVGGASLGVHGSF